MINEKWQALYDNLRWQTDHLMAEPLPELERIETCFECCAGYWQQVKREALVTGFSDDREEILFFTEVKPLFTGRLEFYLLVYHFLLFCPAGGVADIAVFIQNELRKIAQFRWQHQALLESYAKGRTDQDAALFLRRNKAADLVIPYTRPYDMDPDWLTAGDWVLTQHVGNGLYEEFLRDGWGYLPAIPPRSI